MNAYAVSQSSPGQYARGRTKQPIIAPTRCAGHRETCWKPGVEIDHRIALLVAKASRCIDCLAYAFQMDNLQWLCQPCHRDKTAADKEMARAIRHDQPHAGQLMMRYYADLMPG